MSSLQAVNFSQSFLGLGTSETGLSFTKHQCSQNPMNFHGGQLKAGPVPIGDDPDLTPKNTSAVF